METATVTFADLWPIMATMVGSMLAFVIATMRFQHLSIIALRDRFEESNKETRRENRELIEEYRRENLEMHKDTRVLIEKGLGEVRGEIGEVRGRLGEVEQRLARIEGRLDIPPPSNADDGDDASGSSLA